MRNSETDAADTVFLDPVVNAFPQHIKPGAFEGGNIDGIRSWTRCFSEQGGGDFFVQQVDFVHHPQPGLLLGFEFLQNEFHLGVLLGRQAAAGVGNVQYQGGPLDLLQRGAKCRDQGVRQVADETHRIGQQHRSLGRQFDGANGGIQGSKHLRRRQNPRMSQRVEQSRFPCIRISD